ncbi:MAG: carbohydrate kinase [Kineosporiaceae bacterium]|nr:carbohydrate kinase [Kineosporiaceae bacterium]
MDDVLVVGEALVDIVRRLDGSTDEHPGGSPANVALGLGRLGRAVSLLTRFGDDARGESIRHRLESSNVHVVEASRSSAPTSTATATLDAAGVATYDFEIDWRLPEEARSLAQLGDGALPARALHTGSIAAFLPPGGDSVYDLVSEAAGRMTVTYDPNARPRLMGSAATARERVEAFVAHCDLVKVSDEDLEWLAPGEDPAEVIESWLASGPAVVILTRGGAGALGLCRAGQADVSPVPITVVDTVGAGDSFMSGLLDHLAGADLLGGERRDALQAISLRELTAMLEHAVQISAITCQRAGADPPTRADLA